MNILFILVALLAVIFLVWISWSVLEIVYHSVMLAYYAIGYAILTSWDVLSFIGLWTLIKPLKWLILFNLRPNNAEN